jgi:hypothetical protein
MIKALSRIQKALHAPKDNKNSFGNYNYRNCEDILKAVKPLLLEDELVTMSDDIVLIGDRYYVKAIATFTKGNDSHQVQAFAREDLSKKGMDLAQLTGACSSYARKYALGGLLAIDNERDADTQDNTQPQNNCEPVYANDDKEWFNMLNKDGSPDDMKWSKILNLLNKGFNAEQIINTIRETKNINKKEMDYIRGNL